MGHTSLFPPTSYDWPLISSMTSATILFRSYSSLPRVQSMFRFNLCVGKWRILTQNRVTDPEGNEYIDMLSAYS